MQETAVNWAQIGQVMALAFGFGTSYAAFVRWMNRQGINNLTAFVVALGVLVTVLVSVIAIGWVDGLVVLAAFAASGAPMIVEYVLRVHAIDKAQRAAIERDTQEAKRVASEFLK